MIRQIRYAATVLILALAGGYASAQQKIIIDADYGPMSSDEQSVIMAIQLAAEGKLKLLGVTLATGEHWLRQEIPLALRTVERMGVSDKVGVYAGTDAPSRNCISLAQDIAVGGGSLSGLSDGTGAVGHVWQGACGIPQPQSDADISPPADGFATYTRLQKQPADDFIIDAVRRHPHEVTIIAIGPATNIASALNKAPDIAPLIKQVVFQAGNFEAPVTNTFNAWFDASAAQTLIRAPVPVTLISRDVTNTIKLDRHIYQRIANTQPETPVTRLFRDAFADKFSEDPDYTPFIWDTVALAWAIDPELATEIREQYVDFVAAPGKLSGRSLAWDTPPQSVSLQKVKWVRRFNNPRFFRMYVDLLTRPVPVAFGK